MLREIELAVLEIEPAAAHLVDAAALLVVGVAAGSRRPRRRRASVAMCTASSSTASRADADDCARQGAALFAIARADELLVIDAMHPAGEEAAGEGHLQLRSGLPR